MAKLLLLFILMILFENSQPVVRIGAFLKKKDTVSEFILKKSIKFTGEKLAADIVSPSRDGIFETSQGICTLLANDVTTFINTLGEGISMHIHSISDNFEIPTLQVSQEGQTDDYHSFRLNLFPTTKHISKAVADLVTQLLWTEFAIIYEDDSDVSFIKELHDLVEQKKVEHRSKWKMRIFQFSRIDTYRDTFWQIVHHNLLNIVLHVKSANLFEALKQCQQIGLMTTNYTFILTSLDFHTINLSDFKYSRAKIYSFRMVNYDYYYRFYQQYIDLKKTITDLTIPQLSTETALIHDAVVLIDRAYREATKITDSKPENISCTDSKTWQDGTTLMNFLALSPYDGMTGKVFFDTQGSRLDFIFYISELTENGLQEIGQWSDTLKDLILSSPMTNSSMISVTPLTSKSRKLIVATIETKPYTVLRKSHRQKEGNEAYEGYVIDLVNELSKKLNFEWELKVTNYTSNGDCDKDRMQCDGLLGEVTSDLADMALVDLTITSERGEVVDFTHPFINTGISILFKKITNSETDLFGFLSPFTKFVWFVVLLNILGSSIFLHIIGRLCPYEWVNPYPCRQDEDILENDYSFGNSGWFIFAALMQQGSEIAPRSLSTRWLAGVWYFFTLILVSCYTANLAASLATENFKYPFQDVRELVTKNTPEIKRIKIGCKQTGSTFNFFQKSNDEDYKKIYRKMKDNPSWLAQDNDIGEMRVRESNYDYVFFMESATLEYKLERNCTIKQIGGLLDHKGYGIAVKRNSPLLSILNQAILKLQEEGMLQTLYDRWWKQKDGGGICVKSPSAASSVNAFKLINVGGVFIVLLSGIAFSIFVACCELAIAIFKESENMSTFINDFIDDLRFAFKFQKAAKKTRRKISLSRSISVQTSNQSRSGG